MNFDPSNVWILALTGGLAIVGFAVFLLKKGRRRTSRDTGRQFLTMGLIWIVAGLVYSIWKDEYLFDIGMFNLGLVFTLVGIIQLAIDKRKKRSQ